MIFFFFFHSQKNGWSKFWLIMSMNIVKKKIKFLLFSFLPWKKIHWIYKLNIVFFFHSKFHKILIKIIFNSLVLKILYKQSSLRPLIYSQHINHPWLNLIPNQNQGYTSWRNADQTNNESFNLTMFFLQLRCSEFLNHLTSPRISIILFIPHTR